MGQCLNCQKEIQEYTGRRPRKFCSPACRQKHFQAKNKVATTPKLEGHAPTVPTIVKQPEALLNEFMGHTIPEGLTGLQLAVWKNNIKVKAKASKLK